MINIYSLKEPEKPSFIQKIFKQLPGKNAFIEVNNLLADRRICDIKIEEIDAISTKYKADLRKTSKSQLKDLYLQYLKKCYRDNLLSAQEVEDLKKLKELLLLTNSEVESLQEEVARGLFKESFTKIVSDGKIEDSEKEFLDKLKQDLRLPEKMAEKISEEGRMQLIEGRFKSITDDRRVSPEEWEEFSSIAKQLDVTVSMDDSTKGQLEKYKLYWLIENGELPIKPVSIILQKGEYCYFNSYVKWMENRSVTRRINYGGPTARIKIMKGVYYRVGSIGYQKVTTDELKLIDTGQLYVTNKRILFVGARKNTNIKISQIISINPFLDGIGIDKESGKSPVIGISESADILAMILSRVINDL